MIEWTISLGNMLTLLAVFLGFAAHGVVQAMVLSNKLVTLDMRMHNLEKVADMMSGVLVRVAESRTEIKLLSDRMNDIAEHGTRRLAEILVERDGRRRRDGD